MYLKSLELHGFKSFPNRTVLTFERGTTVIVGPNGSGKSNISDAMRWVLGELSSRNIRGTKMEDVIFGGTDQRRPMGYAEVSVTFDNTDKSQRIDSPYDEIKVTRRYYRTGDSEYLINGQQKRLRDITELFMNTGIGREGYSIVGQGRVAELLSKKSEDRRNVFEEAAGIAKYRHRKEDAEKRRRETHANMERVIDIFDELEKRLAPLTKDAEKARKYLDLYEKKKIADVSLWLYDTEKLRADLAKARDTYQLSTHELETVEASLASLNAQDERLFAQMESGRLASEQLLGSINDCRGRIHTLENDISVLDTEIRHKTDLLTTSRGRINEIVKAAKTLSGDTSEYDTKIKELREEMRRLSDERVGILADSQKLTQAIARIEKELETSLGALEKQQNAALDIKVNMDVLSRSRNEDGNRGEGITAAIAECEEAGKRLEGELTLCEKNVEGFTNRISEIEAALKGFDREIEDCRREKE
ncbi:MAG: AAA family ATPase, partial [Clostridia bacterium]|nr:AAA family ATPase [Clostridia bacterium]